MISFIFKGILVLLSLFIYIFCGACLHLVITFIRPSLRWRLFSQLTKIFAKCLRKILSVKVVSDVDAGIVKSGAVLIVSNHLTYLDGIVLGSIFPVVYLSKKEIRNWPLVNWISSISGTIFIDRKRKDKSADYVDEIVRKIRGKVNILLFAEGTSTNGENILPFQSVFFAAPLESGCKILPITIYYTKVNGERLSINNRDKIHWYGRIPFSAHFMQLMRLKNIEVVVKAHDKLIDAAGFQNNSLGRKALAEFTRSLILQNYPYALCR